MNTELNFKTVLIKRQVDLWESHDSDNWDMDTQKVIIYWNISTKIREDYMELYPTVTSVDVYYTLQDAADYDITKEIFVNILNEEEGWKIEWTVEGLNFNRPIEPTDISIDLKDKTCQILTVGSEELAEVF